MNRQKIILIAEKILEYGFYGLIFFLPISKAAIESFAGVIILGFLIKKAVSRDFKSIEKEAAVFWLLLALFFFTELSIANNGFLLTKGLKALFRKWGEYFLVFIIAFDHFRNEKFLRRSLYVFMFSAILVGCSALSQKFFGLEFLRHRRAVEISVTGPFENPNSFSSYLVFCLPFMITLTFWKWPKKILNIFASIACLLLLIALLFTFSRSGWLGFFAGLIVMVFLSKKRRMLLIVLGVFLLSLSLFSPFTQRVVRSFQTGGDSERFVLWRESLSMIKEHPFLGRGLGTYMDYSKKDLVTDVGSHYAHNSYLQMWAETGVFTLLTFLSLAGFVFCRGVRLSLKNRETDLGFLLCGLTAGLLGFLVTLFFDSGLYSLQLSFLFWMLLGLIVALERILLDEGHRYA